MPHCDTLIRDVQIFDGSGDEPRPGSVAIVESRIHRVGDVGHFAAENIVDGKGNALAPGFIDSHTHDDLFALHSPEMLPKLSQGVTTSIVGNCGFSAAPVTLRNGLPDPMNILGDAQWFRYPKFSDYVAAVCNAKPAVNVAALVGHTSLRNNHLDRLDRTATSAEISAMRAQLSEALDHGALGLSTGLAYKAANSASEEEVAILAEALSQAGGIYATHLRTERHQVLEAIQEALRIGQHARAPAIVSHLKTAGMDNWGRSSELLGLLENNSSGTGWDCYPYAASSTILDLSQVDERILITVTWSEPFPELAGKSLSEISKTWNVTQQEAAERLQPGGAVYHCISEEDMREILRHPGTMIGSDGLPNDRIPHPRLWGTFPRVLGVYGREQKLFSMSEAIRKMTSLPAQRFGLNDRGSIREGYAADLVLFDPQTVKDTASYDEPVKAAAGIEAVWVNGVLSYRDQKSTGARAGRFLSRANAANSSSERN